MDTTYESIIGLEVHIQLNTSSKTFSSEESKFSQEPNTRLSAITLGLPGTLPRANNTHFTKAIKLGLSLGCTINQETYFDRKQYMYPDLPKGYQTTQDNFPICLGGTFTYDTGGVEKTIRIHQIHIEEDAGKSIHDQDLDSLVDLNRAGTPLVELVTEPDFRSAQEVFDFYSAIQQWVQYLDISDGNMEEGSIRCDCNVSLRIPGQPYGERCEIKNVNSKRFARNAIEFEIERQKAILNRGELITKSTLTFNPNTGETSPIRSKESVKDYRYFPDPDQSIFKFTDKYLDKIKDTIDWLPNSMKTYFQENYNIAASQINQICQEKETAKHFIELADKVDPKELADLFCQKLISLKDKESVQIQDLIQRNHIIEFVNMIYGKKISKSRAYGELLSNLTNRTDNIPVNSIAKELGMLESEDQDFIDNFIEEVLTEFPDKVQAYRNGRTGLLGFFIGQVKRKSGNKGNPQVMQQKLLERLQ